MELKTNRLSIRLINQNDWKSLMEIWDDFNNSEYARYVDSTDEEPEVDLKALSERMRTTDQAIREGNTELVKMMKELTFSDEGTRETVLSFMNLFGEV